MRWKLAKKLLSRKNSRVESYKYIKRFQALKYATLTKPSLEKIENHCRIITLATPWKKWIWRFKLNSLPSKPILSDGLDTQPEIMKELLNFEK